MICLYPLDDSLTSNQEVVDSRVHIPYNAFSLAFIRKAEVFLSKVICIMPPPICYRPLC